MHRTNVLTIVSGFFSGPIYSLFMHKNVLGALSFKFWTLHSMVHKQNECTKQINAKTIKIEFNNGSRKSCITCSACL